MNVHLLFICDECSKNSEKFFDPVRPRTSEDLTTVHNSLRPDALKGAVPQPGRTGHRRRTVMNTTSIIRTALVSGVLGLAALGSVAPASASTVTRQQVTTIDAFGNRITRTRVVKTNDFGDRVAAIRVSRTDPFGNRV